MTAFDWNAESVSISSWLSCVCETQRREQTSPLSHARVGLMFKCQHCRANFVFNSGFDLMAVMETERATIMSEHMTPCNVLNPPWSHKLCRWQRLPQRPRNEFWACKHCKASLSVFSYYYCCSSRWRDTNWRGSLTNWPLQIISPSWQLYEGRMFVYVTCMHHYGRGLLVWQVAVRQGEFIYKAQFNSKVIQRDIKKQKQIKSMI